MLAWLGAAGAGSAAVITWANLKGFRAMLSEEAIERLRQGATATSIFAAVLLAVAILRYSFGRRGTRATAALLIASMALSVAVPLWLGDPGAARTDDAESPATAARRPALLVVSSAKRPSRAPRWRGARLHPAARGGGGGCRTSEPPRSWRDDRPRGDAEAHTGGTYLGGGGHGNVSAEKRHPIVLRRVQPDDVRPVDLLPDYCFAQALVDLSFVTEDEFIASSALRARAFWSILGDYGIPSGIVDWPLTYPAQADNGYVISDQFDEGASHPLRLARAGAPTTASEITREAFDARQSRPWQDVLPGSSPDEPEPAGVRRAVWDRAYSEAAAELEKTFPVRLTAVRYEGLDVLAHNFLREAEPELFGQLGRVDPHRSILDRYYAYIDAEIGRAASQLNAGDLLLVVSGFGMEAETLPKRLLARAMGWSEQSGSHERARRVCHRVR